MKELKYVIVILAAISLFASCKPQPDEITNGDDTEEENGDTNGTDPELVVYASGYYNSSTKDIACWWKDGVKQPDLTDGTADARATDIFVDGNGIVYAAGYYESGGDNVACWWKNGTQQADLDSEGNPAEANSVFVYNGDVYIAGYYDSGASDVACWWKNGTKQPDLPGLDAEATSVFVYNGDVYISGNYDDGNYPTVATYWVNGVKITTDLFNERSGALDLFVDDSGAVYLSGYYWNGTFASCYWVDDAGGQEPLYTSGISFGYSVFADSTDVYTAGFYQAGADIACYWKNGTKKDLDNGRALDMTYSEGMTYICGYYFDGEKRIAALWEDETRNDLYDSGASGINAEALSLVVQ
jgi:elongation factor P hydroxylase